MATLGGDISRIVFGIQSKIKKLVKLVKLLICRNVFES